MRYRLIIIVDGENSAHAPSNSNGDARVWCLINSNLLQVTHLQIQSKNIIVSLSKALSLMSCGLKLCLRLFITSDHRYW